MAFIRIYRGSNIHFVPESVYESQYKNLGYRIMKDDAVCNRGKRVEPEPVREEKENIDSVPLSDMNQKQLKEYAAQHNIDISEATSAREARAIIRRAIQEGRF